MPARRNGPVSSNVRPLNQLPRSQAVSESTQQVFISHSGLDTWVAKQIQRHISAMGSATFLDEGDIYVGDDFENIILVEIRKSQELVVLLTPWSLKRPYVWLEVGAAWGLEKRLVFVLHGVTEAELSSGAGNPALLKRTNVVELNDIDKYLEQLRKRCASSGANHG